MKPAAICQALEAFLALGDPRAEVDRSPAALARHLDTLAYAVHFAAAAPRAQTHQPEPEEQPELDHRPGEALDQLFPSLGFYNEPLAPLDPDSALTTCDALEDLAGILAEVAEVLARWTTSSEADALWHFHSNYRAHWGGHLRGLQRYLHALLAAD